MVGQQMLLKSGRVLHRASPYEVSAFVRSHIGNHSIELRRNSANATLNYKKLGSIGLSKLTYGDHVMVSNSSGLEQEYHLQMVLEGSCKVRYSESEVFVLTSGAGALINPSDPVALEYSDDCVKLIVKVPVALINSCCIDQVGYVPSGGLHFNAGAFRLEEDCAFWKLIELLCLEADQRELSNHPVGTSIGALVVTKLMEVVPHNLPATVGSSEDGDFFGLIDSYIDSAAGADVAAVDLARLANVSVRTLYDRFKRAKGITPHAYIKTRRLRRIYHRLHASTGSVRSVTEVALEYGFCHLGRFSSEYKMLFGELPSEALRRASLPAKSSRLTGDRLPVLASGSSPQNASIARNDSAESLTLAGI